MVGPKVGQDGMVVDRAPLHPSVPWVPGSGAVDAWGVWIMFVMTPILGVRLIDPGSLRMMGYWRHRAADPPPPS